MVSFNSVAEERIDYLICAIRLCIIIITTSTLFSSTSKLIIFQLVLNPCFCLDFTNPRANQVFEYHPSNPCILFLSLQLLPMSGSDPVLTSKSHSHRTDRTLPQSPSLYLWATGWEWWCQGGCSTRITWRDPVGTCLGRGPGSYIWRILRSGRCVWWCDNSRLVGESRYKNRKRR